MTSSPQTLVLGGGCFWCTEAVFKDVRGITDVESGYSNGQAARPSYEDVCTGRTGCNVDAPTLARLATIPTIVGVKEASGNMSQMADILRAVPDDFLVLSGDDAVTVPLMSIGGRGLISVCSNQIPREMAEMVEAAERGDYQTARRLHQRLLDECGDGLVVDDAAILHQAIVAVGGVGIERHVAHDADLGHGLLDGAHGATDEVLRIAGLAAIIGAER